MNIKTQKGRVYAVTATRDCTVSTNQGVLLCQVTAGIQACFVAPGHEVVVSDESALVTLCEDFNMAPTAASGGGGASISVDQTFSATSENAQSGVAVASAFSNVYYVKNQGSAICIGNGASVAGPGRQALAIGCGASTGNTTAPMAIGMGTKASGECAVSVGCQIDTSGDYAAAFGSRTRNKDKFTTVIGCYNKDEDTFTQLYVMSAGSPLANTYEDGAAALGYVVKNRTTNTIIECGTRKLSELLTNNTAFAPAALGLDDEPTPGPFLPTGILEPEYVTEG